ncbi:hypothetical protein J4474_01665 [Candidatus Pacearchaeota archaeon]|nr:hypothetical protein [Candidatus Pacearchaeota archaeon]
MDTQRIGWREFTRGSNWRESNKVTLRLPPTKTGNCQLISYNPENSDTLFSEILSTYFFGVKYLDVEILRNGIERPIDDGGYLDFFKLEKYLTECKDFGVIPFSSSVLADAEINKDTKTLNPEEVKFHLFPYGISIEESVQDAILKNQRGSKGNINKIVEAIQYAQINNFNSHIISFSTAGEKCNDLIKGIYELQKFGKIGTAILSPFGFFHGKLAIGSGEISPLMNIIFGTEESQKITFSYESGFRNEYQKEFNELFAVILPWWDNLIKKYHDDKFIKR